MVIRFSPRFCFSGPVLLIVVLASSNGYAGGPKFVVGTSFFNPAVVGQPVHWAGGQVDYYVDPGPLNSSISNDQATAMVDAAASIWSAVSTAGVMLTNKGALNEDVTGANVQVNGSGQFSQPADITPDAISYPVAVIFDADGSVINAVYGAGASDPTSCQNNGVFIWTDNINPDATFAHAVILVNGLCATSTRLLEMMSFELERAFGRVLGLDFSQVNSGNFAAEDSWPVMQPISGVCGPSGGECIPHPSVLRYDDIAVLNRIYPITAQNLARFPGKQTTAANTVSIQGTIAFRAGPGMQGVNVVARPLDADGNPLDQYTVSFVSGAYFRGNHGNPVTGFVDGSGTPFSRWGSNDQILQGYFDLSGIQLPPGTTAASYQVSFESIDPLYIFQNSVGPYGLGQVAPSGTLAPVIIPDLAVGDSQSIQIIAADSAVGGYQDAIGTESEPRPMPAGGFWLGRLSQLGQSDWFSLPVRANRLFTVVTEALDERGVATESKALPSIGIWDAFNPIGVTAVGGAPGLNGSAIGETWLRVTTLGDDLVRIGIADLRGDGRPDYAYDGWVLYADTVQPQRLPISGGPIVIHGMGFRSSDTVLVDGQPAVVTSISANEITAIAPPTSKAPSSVNVEVDDLPAFYAAAIITGGISYDSGTGDALRLDTAPANTVPVGTPIPFTVTALGPDLKPAGGVTVAFMAAGGTATLGCGFAVCQVTTTGDGLATLNITAVDSQWSVVTASLANGSSVQTQFAGGTAPILSSLTPPLYLAAGATFTWTVQALALSNGVPSSGQSLVWQASNSGITIAGSGAVLTNSSGIAMRTLSVGPLAEGQAATASACLNGTSQCITYTAFGSRPEYASLQPISGTVQNIASNATPSAIALRLLDMNGNSMAGGTVTLYQALYSWSPTCAPHTVCAQGSLLTAQTSSATSAIDGTVAFAPATLAGIPSNLVGLAASGNSAMIPVIIEQHP